MYSYAWLGCSLCRSTSFDRSSLLGAPGVSCSLGRSLNSIGAKAKKGPAKKDKKQ